MHMHLPVFGVVATRSGSPQMSESSRRAVVGAFVAAFAAAPLAAIADGSSPHATPANAPVGEGCRTHQPSRRRPTFGQLPRPNQAVPIDEPSGGAAPLIEWNSSIAGYEAPRAAPEAVRPCAASLLERGKSACEQVQS